MTIGIGVITQIGIGVSRLSAFGSGTIAPAPDPGPALTWGESDLQCSVETSLADGEVMTITTDTYDFGTKANAKPLLFFDASDSYGQQLLPNADLGRTAAWASGITFNGDLSQAVVATNSTHAVRWDHGQYPGGDGGSLGAVDFTGEQLQVVRTLNHAFDIETDMAFVIQFVSADLVGSLPNVDDTVSAAGSGASGVVQQIHTDATYTYFFLDSTGGTIPTTLFVTDEAVTWTGGSGTNISPWYGGTNQTFNLKPLRMYYMVGGSQSYPDMLMAAQGKEGKAYRISVENIGDTDYLTAVQVPDTWVNERYIYQASSAVDINDGVFDIWFNGKNANVPAQTTRSTAEPGLFSRLYQVQVSNGCQEGSFTYYDNLYVDDSLHGVFISSSATWDDTAEMVAEIQIPITWSGTALTCSLRKGSLAAFAGNYVYVAGAAGTPVKSSGVLLS